MKRIICSFAILFLLFTFVNLRIEALAAETEFLVEDLSTEEKDKFIEYVDMSFLSEEQEKKAIDSFSVSANGLIAIGYRNFDCKIVCIYDLEGVYQYGYKFKYPGAIILEFCEETLNVVFLRSDVVISFDQDGTLVEINRLCDANENVLHKNKILNSTVQEVNGDRYSITKDMGFLNLFTSSYSQLTVERTDGTKSIIYDVSSAHFLSTLVLFIGIFLLVSLSLIGVIKAFRKLK